MSTGNTSADNTNKVMLASDYQEGAHPSIIAKLAETNMMATEGYGFDAFSQHARHLIREACQCPGAEVQFLIGGTQTNATVLDCLLRQYEGVIAADSGHVSVHEAGAIEADGHKVLALPGMHGKLTADQVERLVMDFEADGNREHMVAPGVVYVSQPTEYGTLYSKAELTALSRVCHEHGMRLYVDGARLAYALASQENDVTLADLARLCDAFYIGGTKCGALLGEAVVVPNPSLIPHFFTLIKQHGALLAKGRLLGIQFECLFTDGLYGQIGKAADEKAQRIVEALRKRGITLYCPCPTNQVFFIVSNGQMAKLGEESVYSFWEKYDDAHTVIRYATSWATTDEQIDRIVKIIEEL
ncbi:MAG: beta-eliminating lyase-related protein [Bifidobacteriaceae bacterium]|nr:beta-eliminating lyase-related protein [Bifidobacteriaceae bacterium]